MHCSFSIPSKGQAGNLFVRRHKGSNPFEAKVFRAWPGRDKRPARIRVQQKKRKLAIVPFDFRKISIAKTLTRRLKGTYAIASLQLHFHSGGSPNKDTGKDTPGVFLTSFPIFGAWCNLMQFLHHAKVNGKGKLLGILWPADP